MKRTESNRIKTRRNLFDVERKPKGGAHRKSKSGERRRVRQDLESGRYEDVM